MVVEDLVYNKEAGEFFKRDGSPFSIFLSGGTKRSTNTSGWKGVSWHKGAGKWRAYVGSHGEHLGLFDCPAAAHLAYLVAADERYAEYSRGQ